MVGKIKRWYLNIRLDTVPRFTPSQVTASFSGCEELDVEVWEAEYGTSNLNTLRMFEGIRVVKRVKIVGNIGEEYRTWLENCISYRLGMRCKDLKAVWVLSYGGVGTDDIAEDDNRCGSSIRRERSPTQRVRQRANKQIGIVKTNKVIGCIILVYSTLFVMKAMSHYHLTVPVKSSVSFVSNRSRQTSRKSRSIAGKHG